MKGNHLESTRRITALGMRRETSAIVASLTRPAPQTTSITELRLYFIMASCLARATMMGGTTGKCVTW